MTINMLFSGGATGADTAWAEAARHAGHTVRHYSFAGHKTAVPRQELIVLTGTELAAADPALAHVATHWVKKNFPPHSRSTANLLRRNWYQVREANACYAVSTIKNDIVQGGTGWTVGMFLYRFGMEACPCYVFDQDMCRWFQWAGVGWLPMYTPPRPEGVWAGIGNRALNAVGRLAINVLFDYWPKERRIC